MSRTGPFGLSMGMKLEEVGVESEQVAPGKYRIVAVPKPHSAFEAYVLQIAPACGLSWIKAISHSVQTSVYGVELRSAFHSLENKLSTIYGACEKMDFLMEGSIWNDPKDWMMSLLKGERVLMTEWSPEHRSTLGDSLVSVALVVGAYDDNSGYVAIEYEFQNKAAAEAEISAGEDEAL